MEATTQHVEAVIEGIVSRVRCICGHRRRLPALQSGRESVVWGYRRAFGNISCPTARTGPECARLCRKNVELDGEAALPEAELRELHARTTAQDERGRTVKPRVQNSAQFIVTAIGEDCVCFVDQQRRTVSQWRGTGQPL